FVTGFTKICLFSEFLTCEHTKKAARRPEATRGWPGWSAQAGESGFAGLGAVGVGHRHVVEFHPPGGDRQGLCELPVELAGLAAHRSQEHASALQSRESVV